MNKSIYILTSTIGSEKFEFSVLLLKKMKQTNLKVGYFKPIVSSEEEKTRTKQGLSQLGVENSEVFLYSISQVMALQNQGKINEVFDSIIAQYKKIEQRCDVVLVEASDLTTDNFLFQSQWNTSIAKGLGIPVISVDRYVNFDQLQSRLTALIENNIPVIKQFVVGLQQNTLTEALLVDTHFLSEVSLSDALFQEVLKCVQAFVFEGKTSRMFQYEMIEKARKAQKHIVLPEGGDDRVLTAASKLASDKLVYLTVLGDEQYILNRAKVLSLNWDSQRIKIVDPVSSQNFELYAQKLHELRQSKGLDLEGAKKLMQDVSYYGTMMVYMGDADGMVSGAVNTTAHTIRPSLQFVKTKQGVNTVSSVFFMMLPDRVVVYADCAIVPNPTAEQLAEIAITSADTAQIFGIDPKVAMLSYSSGTSGSGPDVDKVREATEIVKTLRPDLCIDGPIQYDAAVDMKVGKSKMPTSPVAGRANVLIFPDLSAGNNAYKAVQRETRSLAIGPVLQGLRKPVNDLSRGALIGDIYNTVLITALQA